jgi:hypothetical protein
VIVLERWERPYPLQRAVALAHDVVRVLHTLELGTRFSDLLICSSPTYCTASQTRGLGPGVEDLSP